MSDSNRQDKRWKRTVVWIVILAVVLAIGAYFVPSWLAQDPLKALASGLGVNKDALILNLPPRPARYPGTILLSRLENAPVVFIESDDEKLHRGEVYELQSTHESEGRFEGSLDSAVLGQVAEGLEQVDLQIDIPKGQVVEMLVPDLRAQVEGSSNVADPGAMDVIVRSFEGPIRYRLKRRSEFSLELWRSFVDGLVDADADDRLVEVDADSSSDSEIAIRVTEPIVFAYLVSPASDLLAVVSIDEVIFVPRSEMRSDPQAAVDGLLEIGAEELPDATRSLREIGPEAEPILEEVIRSDDEERKLEGVQLYMRLPPITNLAPGAPGEDLHAVRAGATHGAAGVSTLTRALSSDDIAARLLAVEYLGRLDTTAASAADALRARLSDSDTAVRVAAAGALLRVQPTAMVTVEQVELAGRHPDPAVRSRAMRSLDSRVPIGDATPLLERGLRDSSPEVRLDVIETIRGDAARLRALAPELEHIDRSDPRIDDAVTDALRDAQDGGG